MNEEMTEIPPCIFCKNCKRYNGDYYPHYYCKNTSKVDEVTGKKLYNLCQNVRKGKYCNFKPSLVYKIVSFFLK